MMNILREVKLNEFHFFDLFRYIISYPGYNNTT